MKKIKVAIIGAGRMGKFHLETLKDMYISSRIDSMSETDLRVFVKEIIIDQIISIRKIADSFEI